ncbi:MAG: hypothetical protein HY321_03000, partial [Armatimonadetes bacterium]|nr:hypothetical protein [Armatimonadota bacterium]
MSIHHGARSRGCARAGLLALLTAGILSASARRLPAAVYANITDVTVGELRNSVQITVKADGVLRYEGAGRYGGTAQRIELKFPGARSRVGKPYISVDKVPVSGIMLAVPQNAPEGIGIEMTIVLNSTATYSIRESADQQSVIITVERERTIEGTRPGAPAAGGEAASSLDVRFEGGLLSVRAVKTDMHALLGRLAEVAKVDIAVDDQVSRTASLTLEALPVDAVLRAIASA